MVMGRDISTALTGMKAIADYSGLSEPTILQLARMYPDTIPVRKLAGQWCSDRVAWDRWWRCAVKGQVKETAQA